MSLFLALLFFFFSSRRRHTRALCDWSSVVCSSDLEAAMAGGRRRPAERVDGAARTARLPRRPRERLLRLGGDGELRDARRRSRPNRPGGARRSEEPERMTDGYEVASIDDLDRYPVEHGLEWRPVRRRF